MDVPDPSGAQDLPPIVNRLFKGTLWLALQVPLQIVLSLWSLRLIVEAIGPDRTGGYRFAVGFGFLQIVFEFGAGAAFQQRMSEAWTRGDREGMDRAIACGTNFYAAASVLQAAALLGVAYLVVPYAGFEGASRRLVVDLLWLQAAAAPGFAAAAVVSSVLQAARRYDFAPRFELAITVLRFVVLTAGLKAGVAFFWVVAAQTALIIVLRVGPALWVMVRELGLSLRFRGARWVDYKTLGRFSFYVFLIQVGVATTDKMDATILGFASARPGPDIAVYDVVSKPFLLLRQTGLMLASMVTPAVAGLAAAHDARGLERIKYDGTRLHIGALAPMGILAWIHAAPFLSLWFGRSLGYDAADAAPLMRLLLAATIPLVLSVPVQTAVGVGEVKVIALIAAVGMLVNLPLSCWLVTRLGVAGVIWGTILTTLALDLAASGIYVFRILKIEPWIFLKRTLAAPSTGAFALIAATWAMQRLASAVGPPTIASHPGPSLVLHLIVGTAAYLGGYALIPDGRNDFIGVLTRIQRRWIADPHRG